MFVISLLIISTILFGTKVQTKTRKTVSDYWCNYDWETTDKRAKWPIWFLFISYIVSIIPFINIVYAIFIVWWFEKQYNEICCSNDGGNLIQERIVFSNKFIDWLKSSV